MYVSAQVEDIILKRLSKLLSDYSINTDKNVLISASGDFNRICLIVDYIPLIKNTVNSKNILFIFQQNGNHWELLFKQFIDPKYTVRSMDMAYDGKSLAIGLCKDNSSDSSLVEVLTESNDSWESSKIITAPDESWGDSNFGNSIIMSSDGYLIISSPTRTIADAVNVGCFSIYKGKNDPIIITPPIIAKNDYFSSEIYMDEIDGGAIIVTGNFTGLYILELSEINIGSLKLVKK